MSVLTNTTIPVKGNPLEMTDEQKREALRKHVLGMIQHMNRKQRRAFVKVAQKTGSLDKATEAAIANGFMPIQTEVK